VQRIETDHPFFDLPYPQQSAGNEEYEGVRMGLGGEIVIGALTR
jgi:hypothetical protein